MSSCPDKLLCNFGVCEYMWSSWCVCFAVNLLLRTCVLWLWTKDTNFTIEISEVGLKATLLWLWPQVKAELLESHCMHELKQFFQFNRVLGKDVCSWNRNLSSTAQQWHRHPVTTDGSVWKHYCTLVWLWYAAAWEKKQIVVAKSE